MLIKLRAEKLENMQNFMNSSKATFKIGYINPKHDILCYWLSKTHVCNLKKMLIIFQVIFLFNFTGFFSALDFINLSSLIIKKIFYFIISLEWYKAAVLKLFIVAFHVSSLNNSFLNNSTTADVTYTDFFHTSFFFL